MTRKPSKRTLARAQRKLATLETIRTEFRTIIEVATALGLKKKATHEYLNELAAAGLATKVNERYPGSAVGITRFKANEGATLSLGDGAAQRDHSARALTPDETGVLPDPYMHAMVAVGRETRT